MTTPADSPRARLVELISRSLADNRPVPWESAERRLAGVPRSGSTGKWYSGLTPWLLWAEAAEHGWQSGVWHTAGSVDATVDNDGVKMGRSTLYPADRLGLAWPSTPADAVAAAARVEDLRSFTKVVIRPSVTPMYDPETGITWLPAAEAFADPAERAATLLELLVLWTRAEGRIDRSDDALEPLVGALGGALLAAAFRVPGRSTIATDWRLAVAHEGELLVRAIDAAEQAVTYLLDLAHPALRAELDALDADGVAPRPTGAGFSVDLVTSLGQLLLADEDDLRDPERQVDEEPPQQPLVLAEAAGSVLHDFLATFAHGDTGTRRNPPICAWLAGGPGTGRNQVVAALNALFRTGGTDLSGTLVSSEGGLNLLAMIERVWSDQDLMVLPAVLPQRVRAAHDRAIPTACLSAFHVAFGLSPHLWVARLEHRLLRSGEYVAFADAFREKTGRSWAGEGNRNPEAFKEAMIAALGGAATGARRRVTHYEKTRRTASWEALKDETEWSLFHLKPGDHEPSKRPLPNCERRRVLFVLDLANALDSDDGVSRGWLRRMLSTLPARMEEAARPEHRPLWYLLTPDTSLKELGDLVQWEPKVRRKQVAVDLDTNPVTAAVGTELLSKDAAACGPIYALYAGWRDALHALATVEGLVTAPATTRDALLASFPFLPPVLPMAQAILDTFASDREALPLQSLVRKALDEHYYAPPDRFVPLDVLLEPMIKVLEVSSSSAAAPASARIFVGAPAVAAPVAQSHRAAFPPETVLQTIRWANRVRGFPCTAANLVPLMAIRMDRPVADMIAEVEATLENLVKRDHIRRVPGSQVHTWMRGL